MSLGLEDVFGDVHQDWTRTATGREVKRLMNDLRKLRKLLHHEIVLGAGARDAERIGFLEGVAADQFGRHLPGDRHNWDRIHERVDQCGHQIRRAGTGRRAAHADLARGARVSLSREARVLLVAHQDVLDLVIVKRVIQRQRHAAGISEEGIHLLAQQAFEDDLRTRHQFGRHSKHPPKKLCSKKPSPKWKRPLSGGLFPPPVAKSVSLRIGPFRRGRLHRPQ